MKEVEKLVENEKAVEVGVGGILTGVAFPVLFPLAPPWPWPLASSSSGPWALAATRAL